MKIVNIVACVALSLTAFENIGHTADYVNVYNENLGSGQIIKKIDGPSNHFYNTEVILYTNPPKNFKEIDIHVSLFDKNSDYVRISNKNGKFDIPQ